jgi:hypothetical protein
MAEHPDDIKEVKRDLARFFEILDITETSMNDREFHPVTITSVREQLRAELNTILSSLKTWSRS